MKDWSNSNETAVATVKIMKMQVSHASSLINSKAVAHSEAPSRYISEHIAAIIMEIVNTELFRRDASSPASDTNRIRPTPKPRLERVAMRPDTDTNAVPIPTSL
jgi:hypothetical protein